MASTWVCSVTGLQKEAALCVLCARMKHYGEFWSVGEGNRPGFVCNVCRVDLELDLVRFDTGDDVPHREEGDGEPQAEKKDEKDGVSDAGCGGAGSH